MMHRLHFPVLIALLLIPPAVAQSDRTDDFIRAEMRRQNIPGLSLAVLKSGEMVKIGGYGRADIKRDTPATPDTVYKIASASKQFIAAGIMVLAQEGRLRVDDPVSRYLKETPATWRDITIRHLLTHTAGLVREGPAFNAQKAQSDADVIRSAYALPLRFAPGEKWQYSNLGYFALAEIIRTASGQPWSEFLAEKIFKPAGMLSTHTTADTAKAADLAQGYVDNNALREAPRWVAVRPSGAFLSTVRDLAKWDSALYTDRILTAATRQEMWTPITLADGSSYPYGYGWMTGQVRGHRFVHHPGGMPGARADIARFIDAGVTIIVLMNLDDVEIDSIVNGLAALHLPETEKR